VKHVTIGDSSIIIKFLLQQSIPHNPSINRLVQRILAIAKKFETISFQVLRAHNSEVDSDDNIGVQLRGHIQIKEGHPISCPSHDINTH
jgi:hypothetical protein